MTPGTNSIAEDLGGLQTTGVDPTTSFSNAFSGQTYSPINIKYKVSYSVQRYDDTIALFYSNDEYYNDRTGTVTSFKYNNY